LIRRLSGRSQDLTAVEKAVAGVRKRGALRYDDIQAIVESPNFSAGKQFWTWPGRSEIEAALGSEKLDLWHLPKNERPLIKKLRAVFRTVDAASVILRFIMPREYGILSVPVEHVLGIQPSTSSIERYLCYVRDLRAIRDKYKFETAAQVDQALWTLHVGVSRGFLPDSEHLKRAHSKDKFLRSIRVKNLADALFSGISRIDLVEALAGYRLTLAGELAALEFERAVRGYCKCKSDEDLKTIIAGCAPGHLKGDWQWCRSRRNEAVHAQKDLSHHEVATLILRTREILVLTQALQRRRQLLR
jgi:hypothetical protein